MHMLNYAMYYAISYVCYRFMPTWPLFMAFDPPQDHVALVNPSPRLVGGRKRHLLRFVGQCRHFWETMPCRLLLASSMSVFFTGGVCQKPPVNPRDKHCIELFFIFQKPRNYPNTGRWCTNGIGLCQTSDPLTSGFCAPPLPCHPRQHPLLPLLLLLHRVLLLRWIDKSPQWTPQPPHLHWRPWRSTSSQ